MPHFTAGLGTVGAAWITLGILGALKDMHIAVPDSDGFLIIAGMGMLGFVFGYRKN